ncbi:putative mitochondrial carrier protein [Aspergillus lucknowensis]|uniref:Mitochondrial carrier domain-containing protein n=1 Tax=Aspergillus lucknowensis TaxID=176173 RepID=A0ABR4M670_9EURO
MENSSLDIWISGAVAVVTVDFLVYPFDTLKTRMQSPGYSRDYKDAATNTIRKNVLFRGLYQGVFSVVLSTIPASGAFFTTYEKTKSILNGAKFSHPRSTILQSTPTPLINALSSSAGEMVSCLLLTPAEVIKQNAQVIHNNPLPAASASGVHPGSQGTRSGGRIVTLQVLSRFRAHPWRLWSGYSALVGRNLPFTGLNFPIFEFVKGELVAYRRKKKKHLALRDGLSGCREIRGGGEPVMERAVLTGIAASISGGIASVITTPIDVVKTRMMLAASESRKQSSRFGRRTSIWGVGKEVFSHEGMRGLFRGGAIRVVWTAVSLSIYLGMYEGGRFYLEKKRGDRNAVAEL